MNSAAEQAAPDLTDTRAGAALSCIQLYLKGLPQKPEVRAVCWLVQRVRCDFLTRSAGVAW